VPILPVEDWFEAEEERAELAHTTLIAPVQWFEKAAVAEELPYDKPSLARRGLIRRPGGRFEHFCAVCGSWGSFGYGVSVKQTGRWFCFRHRELGNDLPADLDETRSL
jgi:hypothetical protein